MIGLPFSSVCGSTTDWTSYHQKQLRLLEARRLMLAENSTATNAADLVGYENPSQFSREYARMFGALPMQDIDRLKINWSTPQIPENSVME
jgi:AraC-like DNA-binding protein